MPSATTEVQQIKSHAERPGSGPRLEAVPFPSLIQNSVLGDQPTSTGLDKFTAYHASAAYEHVKAIQPHHQPVQLPLSRTPIELIAAIQLKSPSNNIESHSSNSSLPLPSHNMDVSISPQATSATYDSVHIDTLCHYSRDEVATACSSAPPQELEYRYPAHSAPEDSVLAQRLRRVPSTTDASQLQLLAAQRNVLSSLMRNLTLGNTLQKIGLVLPSQAHPSSVPSHSSTTFVLNKPLQRTLSEFVLRTKLLLTPFVESVRRQTPVGYQPNKDIVPAVLDRVCTGYKHL